MSFLESSQNNKNNFLNSLDLLSLELGRIATTNKKAEIVDLETFLYNEDYLNISPNKERPIKLSKKQFEFLEALDDDNINTNFLKEAVIVWGKGCIDGSSIIEDVNGKKYTVDQLEQLYKNKDFKIKIKSYNEKTKQLEEDIIDDVWIKGEDDLYEIQLENGNKIQVTLNHKFLTKDGWKMLKDLKEGDEIFSYEA